MRKYTLTIKGKPILKSNGVITCVFEINALTNRDKKHHCLIDNTTGEVLSCHRYLSQQLVDDYMAEFHYKANQ